MLGSRLQQKSETNAALPEGVGYDTTRSRLAGFFITPDTSPSGFTVRRSRAVAPAFLLLFVAGGIAINSEIVPATHVYGAWIAAVAHVSRAKLGKQISIAVRPYFLLLCILLSVFSPGRPLQRLRLLCYTLSCFSALVVVTDLAVARFATGTFGPFGAFGNVIAGLDGVAALAVGVFANAALPPSVIVKPERRRPKRDLAFLVLALVGGAGAVVLIETGLRTELRILDKVPLLGGAGSVLVLFFSVVPLMLYVLDNLRHRSPSPEGGSPRVGIIIPARNEQGLIGDCIRAIDQASAGYPGGCTVYVIENGSSDSTYDEAASAIASLTCAEGVLLQCEPKGKAFALNRGIERASEEILIRIDADTLITRSVLVGLTRHFGDPSVGGASGMPLPRDQSSWICRMRALEVYYQVGFKRTGYNSLDAIGVLPGALVAYRRALLLKLNGFAEGVNGEDADMAVRVGRLGYRLVSDRSVRAYTEMPSTFSYLREQRMRWARGTYHMLARNRSGIVMLQGIRCVWMLPWAAFIMFRRLMIIPFAAVCLALIILTHSFLPLREVAAGGAILLGFQLLQMTVAMTLLGDVRLIATIPGYVVFRLIVSFFALETLLGLALKPVNLPTIPRRQQRVGGSHARLPPHATATLSSDLGS